MKHAQPLPAQARQSFPASFEAWRSAGLSVRASAVLALEGCSTVAQVAALGRAHFAGKPNVGVKTLNELAGLVGWPAKAGTPLDAVASALSLGLDPEEAREAAADALNALRRSGFSIIADKRREARA
jgi:hypothetical protein